MAVSFQNRRQESAMHPVKAEAKISETTGFCVNIVAEADPKLRRGLRGRGLVAAKEDPRAEAEGWREMGVLGPVDFGAKGRIELLK